MEKYQAKPDVVEAGQWWEFKEDEDGYYLGVSALMGYGPSGNGKLICSDCVRRMKEHGWLRTFDGGYTVCPGDWIVRGVDGERHPFKPVIFEKVYEVVIARKS